MSTGYNTDPTPTRSGNWEMREGKLVDAGKEPAAKHANHPSAPAQAQDKPADKPHRKVR